MAKRWRAERGPGPRRGRRKAGAAAPPAAVPVARGGEGSAGGRAAGAVVAISELLKKRFNSGAGSRFANRRMSSSSMGEDVSFRETRIIERNFAGGIANARSRRTPLLRNLSH